jgi:two-component system OmpR family sensor kinase
VRTGTFGLLQAPDGRWRAFVLPLRDGESLTGYLVALAPLSHLDATMNLFRGTLVTLALIGLAVALLSSYAIAGRALRPVDHMVQTAQAIALEHDLSRRVPAPPQSDELGRLAETLNAMLASLEASARAQQRFVADASHELRAPLTAIQGNLELLRMQAVPAGESGEMLADVEREAARLGRLVADLLALARADSGLTLPRRPVDLDQVVIETLGTAQPLVHGQALAVEPFEPAQVLGDADRLRQLVLLLLDNALKYTPPEGSVTLGLRRDGAEAEITVRDTGVGIPAADLPHVFERFYRADPARGRDPGGTGLGLPIARWIVEQHGGSIALASEPGRGTLATVRLPLAA